MQFCFCGLIVLANVRNLLKPFNLIVDQVNKLVDSGVASWILFQNTSGQLLRELL